MAFDLVAKLKLQDEFSDKLKSVFAQLDKLKGQVKQAATGTSDMGAKFSAASTKMSTALDKVQSKTVDLPKKFESFSNVANRSLEAVSKGATTIGTSTDSAAKLSQASLKMLGGRADEAAKKLTGVGSVGAKSLNSVVSTAAKVPGPVGLVAKAAKLSQGALKVLGGTSSKTFKLMSTDSTASVKLMTTGAQKMSKVFSASGIKSSNAFQKVSTKAKSVQDALKRAGDGGKRAFDMMDRSLFRIPSKMGGFVSKMRSGFKNGISGPASTAKNAVMGIATAVGAVALASKGFQLLKGAIEGAVARYDTLNAFPKVMEKIGFSTDESTKSIKRLAEGIDGLPTTLGEVTDTAQRIAVMTKDLDKATETTLALNNAFLASGADADKAARGTEQYIKMIATGKVGLDSWTTLQETMGLALNDLAEAFGYTGKSAQNDLYKALKDGDVTFDQFNEKLVELSKATGGFAETALDGSGGIATAWKNIKTAITNGVAGSITEIDKALGGTGEIEGALLRMKGLVKSVFTPFNTFIGKTAKLMKKLYDDTKPFHSILMDIGKAALIFIGVLGGMSTVAGMIAGTVALFALIGSGVGLAILAVAGLVTGFVVAYQKIEPFRNAVQDLLGTFKEVFNVLKTGSGGGDLMKKMGFSEEQIQVARDFADNVRETFEKMKDGFRQLGDFFVAKGQELAPTLDILAEAFAIGKEVLVSVFTTLWEVLKPIFGALKNALMIVADIAVMAWTQIIAPAVKFAMTIFQTAWAIIGPILKLLGSAIGAAFEVLKLAWDNVMKPVANFLMGRFKVAFENLTPILNSVKDGFDLIGRAIEKVAGWFDSFKTAISRFKVPKWLSKLGGGGTVKFEGGGDDGGGEGRYNGIKYVPRDGYNIRAHRGERVLTAKENKEYNKGGGNGRAFVINMNGTVIREEADVDRLAEKMVRKFIAAGEGGA
ncbi:hypothetical protein CSV63_03005 [Sporosarcina sp. P34]|uniref:tape measure protein n=1 Tax=Sporosarcina sp. P34 TaxID=2048247 RepID=UPI000C163C07|nr:tape measure protein [Sporosarcina sp. P34]PID16874.1 hypothetical protein CSV63_03005 [Sporosarcina sp. P34]